MSTEEIGAEIPVQFPEVNILRFSSRRERRKFPRMQVLMKAEISLLQTAAMVGVVTNISLSGICLRTRSPAFSIGEKVKIRFTFLPGKLLLPVKVIRALKGTDGIEYGMEFFDLSDQSKEELRKFLYTLL